MLDCSCLLCHAVAITAIVAATNHCNCNCYLLQEGITAILTASSTDVLSHIAIRARAQKVLLASCFDAAGGWPGWAAVQAGLGTARQAGVGWQQLQTRQQPNVGSGSGSPLQQQLQQQARVLSIRQPATLLWAAPDPTLPACLAVPAELEGIQSQAGGHVAATVTPTGDVIVSAAEASSAGGASSGGRGGGAPCMQLERPKGANNGAWVLPESQFGPGLVGGKSANLAALRSKLPAGCVCLLARCCCCTWCLCWSCSCYVVCAVCCQSPS